ncbi:phage virion morphogenesis protein [Sinomicrobium kalidii]|uniref:phage virion morphogenesis protein n=1 Tax=Sinomicrobium kalidii TaxID=2900738 RepID=UPI001E308EB2|nr:phage virion morphogenesis protein [Sinomicrobium kalidii]UGU15202.1 phage virion morphogenesis protein [Sinomicrobium kalidii]
MRKRVITINRAPDFSGMLEALKRDQMRYAKVTAVNFFKERFFEQGWLDVSFEAWEGRKHNDRPGGAILTQTGNLRDSIRVLQETGRKITFGTEAPYAEIHNSGGVIVIHPTTRMKRFFWYMFKATGQQRYKWMALSKDPFRITIPKRQFIGESGALMDDFDTWLKGEIIRRFQALI